MVIKLFRWLMYFILAIVFLFALAVAWIRFAPSSLFGIVEKSSGYRLEADDFSLTFSPLSINTKQLIISDATQESIRLLELDDGQVSIKLWHAIRGISPFWSLSAKQTILYLPEVTEESKTPTAKPAAFDIRPYLSFANIEISNLKIVKVGQDKSQDILISTSIIRQNAGQYEVSVEYKSGSMGLAVGSFLEYKRVGERSKLKLTSDTLDLTSLIAPATAVEKVGGPAGSSAEAKNINVPEKSDELQIPGQEGEIAWGWLTTLGKLDLELSIGKLILGRNQINNLDASLGFDPKEIRIDKLKGDVIAYVPLPSDTKPVPQAMEANLAENKQTDSTKNQVVAKPVPTETIFRETISIDGVFKPLDFSTQGADADGKFNLSTAKIKIGSVGRFNFNGLDQNKLKLDVKIDKLGSLAPLLPKEIEPYIPLHLKTDIALATNTYAINNMQLNFAKSDLAGDVYVNSSTDIFKIKADLKSKLLHYIKPEDSESPPKAIKPEEKPAPTEKAVAAINPEATAEGAAVDSSSATTAIATKTETTTNGAGAVPASDAAKESSAGAGNGSTAAKVAETGPDKAQGPKVLSDKPLDWSWLKIADIDVSVVAETLKINNYEFSKFTAVAKADQGKLWIFPLSASLGEGDFEADISLDSQDAGADFKVYLVAKNIDLGSLELIDKEEFQGGLTQVKIDITAAGASPQVIAASLDGRIVFILQKATIKTGVIDVFGSDALVELRNKMNPFAEVDPKTQLECVSIDFKAEKGVLKSNKKLVMESSKMVVEGIGEIDLNDESIDIRIFPTAKQGLGISAGNFVKFIKLGGTLAQPRPVADTTGLLQTAATMGLTISTGGVSVIAGEIAKKAITSAVTERILKEATTLRGNACEQALAKFDSVEGLPEEKKEMPVQMEFQLK